MQKVRFAYNPKAGETVITDWLDNIIDIYQRGGYSIMPYRLAFTEAEETDLLDDIDGSYHHILVAGGDGTVNYVVNMLKRRNLDLPVAVLPTGTANDFANTLGVPSDIEKACRRILGGEIRRVDLGRANDEYFVNVFSCGLFTDVSQKTPTILKNTFGKLAYYFGGLGELPNFRKMHISIESDGGNYEGPSLIFFVFNGRTAGQMRFAYLSEIDDGLLDVIVIKGDRPIETVRTIFHFIKRNTKDYPAGIVHFKSRDILLHSYNEETTDIDGQPGPRFPVRIACEPGALRVICPQKKPDLAHFTIAFASKIDGRPADRPSHGFSQRRHTARSAAATSAPYRKKRSTYEEASLTFFVFNGRTASPKNRPAIGEGRTMVSISRPREQAVTNDAAEQQQIDGIGNPAAAAVEIGGHHDGERSGRQHEVRHRASGRGQRQEGEEQNPQKIDGGFVGARPHRAAAPPKRHERQHGHRQAHAPEHPKGRTDRRKIEPRTGESPPHAFPQSRNGPEKRPSRSPLDIRANRQGQQHPDPGHDPLAAASLEYDQRKRQQQHVLNRMRPD